MVGVIFDPVLAVFFKKTREVVGQSHNYMGYGIQLVFTLVNPSYFLKAKFFYYL